MMIEPGIYKDISNEAYHGGEGVSKSVLDLIHRSPAHYRASLVLPKRETAALTLGTAIHAAVLEPESFEANFVAAPDVDRRTSAGRAAWTKFQLDTAGKKILTREQYDTALHVRDAVYGNRMAVNLLCGGTPEQSVYWAESLDGQEILCKCRPDYLRRDGLIVDLKTTEDARADHFLRSVTAYRYHVQCAWYLRGIEEATGDVRDFVFLAVEKEPPYGIGIFTLPPEFVDAGVYAAMADLRVYAKCKKADYWPCYPEEVQVLDMPRWFKG